MNKMRRNALCEAIGYLNTAKSIIESAQSEEEDYRDNMPENLQESARYKVAEDACENMDDANSSLDDVIEWLSNAMS